MRHIDLCSGIGGFAYAAREIWQDEYQTVCFCEIEKFCTEVLQKRFPHVAIEPNIYQFDARKYRGTIDLVTAGFPCQPYSIAGKRLGSADDRAIWPEVFRIIGECRPRWFIGENVDGIVSMEQSLLQYDLEDYAACIAAAIQYQTDLRPVITGRKNLVLCDIVKDIQGQGYEVETVEIPACAVDAQHFRQRIWIIAHDAKSGCEGQRLSIRPGRPKKGARNANGNCADVSHTKRTSFKRWRERAKLVETSKPTIEEVQRLQPTKPFYYSTNDANTNGQSHNWSAIPRQEYCQWQIEPDVGRVANGIPRRLDRLAALGNAIVPQVAMEIMNFMREIDG